MEFTTFLKLIYQPYSNGYLKIPSYNWNIVESDAKHHNPNPLCENLFSTTLEDWRTKKFQIDKTV
jgi:hypothetical protein